MQQKKAVRSQPNERLQGLSGWAVLVAIVLIALTTGPDALAANTPNSATTDQIHNTLSSAEKAADWRLLFDGESLTGWRTYKQDRPGKGWKVISGDLIIDGRGGDLITKEKFQDFELQLDWIVQSGGNSGVFFRADEKQRYIFLSAPEMQILDDQRHADGKNPLTSAGSNYALHPVPRGVVNPAGQWNHARLRVDGKQVTHWLNGTEIVNYEIGSADWLERKANSKFAKWEAYGSLDTGHIGLQDHGDRVAFRNIKVRELNVE